jgi:hypothetical protein
MSAGVALTLLGSVINALGGNLGIQASYSQARTATIAFDDVLEDRVNAIDVDRDLGDADVDPFDITSRKLLDADKLYVVTAVVKSTKMKITANDSNDAALKVDVPVVQQAVGANVTVSASNTSKTQISYEGKIPLVFGFQAIQLLFEGTDYQQFRVLPAGGGQMKAVRPTTAAKGKAKRAGAQQDRSVPMPISTGLVRLNEFV